MLSSDFEVIHEGSKSQNACLFHDSIDAIFDSKDFPIGFNVFDLQGYACEDFFLIEKLLKNMPDVFIMVFVRTHDWFKKLAECLKEDPETKALFISKLLVVAQYTDKREKIRSENIMKNDFGHLLNDKKTINCIEIDNSIRIEMGSNITNLSSKCEEIYEELTVRAQAIALEFDQEQTAEIIVAQNRQLESSIEYDKIYGQYWLMADNLAQVQSESPQIRVNTMPDSFRKSHMDMKDFIFKMANENPIMLTREHVMPLYMKELLEHKKRKIVCKEEPTEEDKEEVNALDESIARVEKIEAGENPVFNEYYKALLEEKHELAHSILELLESNYHPKIKDDNQRIRQLKEQANEM